MNAKVATLAIVASMLALPAAFAADTTGATATAPKPTPVVAKKKAVKHSCAKKCSKVAKRK